MKKEQKQLYYNSFIERSLKINPSFYKKLTESINTLQDLIKAFNHVNLGVSKPDYESMSFRERAYAGHLLPFLFGYDLLVSGRQMWWQDMLKEPGLLSPSKKIPQIDFLLSAESSTLTMLKDCITGLGYKYDDMKMMDYFLDYLLYGMADSSVKNIDHIPDEVIEHFYKEFDIFFMVVNPYDYFGDILPDIKSKGSKQSTGFFPTPAHVVQFMTEIAFNEEEGIYSSVVDPCVGTGRMILYASNRSINLCGQDIDNLVLRACRVNLHIYAPFAVRLTEEVRNKIDVRHTKQYNTSIKEVAAEMEGGKNE